MTAMVNIYYAIDVDGNNIIAKYQTNGYIPDKDDFVVLEGITYFVCYRVWDYEANIITMHIQEKII